MLSSRESKIGIAISKEIQSFMQHGGAATSIGNTGGGGSSGSRLSSLYATSKAINDLVRDLAIISIQRAWRFRMKFATTKRLASTYVKHIPSLEMAKSCR